MPIFNSLSLRTQNKKGFTLVELLIAVSIIAIVSAVGITSYTQAQKLARDAKRKQDLRSIAVALELFYQRNNRYPCSGNPATWTYSTSVANWVQDKTATEVPGASCASVNTAISPTYINTIPSDPINSGSFRYGYWQGSCSGINSYALTTLLENSSDKETIRNKVLYWCGSGSPQLSDGAGTSPANWNLDTFLLASW